MPIVWVAYPGVRVFNVHLADGSITALRPGDTLTADPILPGLEIAVELLLPVTE